MPGARRLLAALLAATVLAAAAAAGCGGADVNRDGAYVDQVNAAQSQFASTVKRLTGRVTADSSPSEDRRTLRSFTKAVDEVVVDLRRIQPPKPVQGLHRELVSDMDAYAGEVHSAASSLTSGNADKLVASQQRLLRATTTVSEQINRSIDQINQTLRKS
jgi:hypothetical protein